MKSKTNIKLKAFIVLVAIAILIFNCKKEDYVPEIDIDEFKNKVQLSNLLLSAPDKESGQAMKKVLSSLYSYC